jgi:uncharacterized protein YhdP
VAEKPSLRAAPAKTRGWFTLEAGALIRGQVRRELEKAAWERGLDIKTDESKGFFESVYRFTVTGESKAVVAFINDSERWFKENFDD